MNNILKKLVSIIGVVLFLGSCSSHSSSEIIIPDDYVLLKYVGISSYTPMEENPVMHAEYFCYYRSTKINENTFPFPLSYFQELVDNRSEIPEGTFAKLKPYYKNNLSIYFELEVGSLEIYFYDCNIDLDYVECIIVYNYPYLDFRVRNYYQIFDKSEYLMLKVYLEYNSTRVIESI